MADESHERAGWTRGRIIGGGLAVLAVASVLGLLLVGLTLGGAETSIRDALDAGERPPAPELGLPVLIAGGGLEEGDGPIEVEDLAGRPVVLNFWASWCTPCENEAPLLESLWTRYEDRGVLFLGVDTEDLSESARRFARDFGLTYPSLRDGTDATKRRWQASGVPETFILDAEGRIAAHVIGEVTRPEQITTPLEQLL